MGETINVIAYKSKILSNGEHPLMLRIAKDGKRIYKSLGLSCHPKKWNFKKQKPKKSHIHYELLLAAINTEIHKIQEKILSLKARGITFTINDLIKSHHQEQTKEILVFHYYDILIKRLEQSHKVGNANVYRDSLRSLKGFVDNKHLSFDNLTYSFLNKYETYLRSRNLSESTCSVYFRTLRSVYNKAIKEKIVDASKYPFQDFQVASFKVNSNRRALTKEDICSLTQLDLNGNAELFETRQYFLFSYYGQGINFTDIARLKWSNLNDGRILYIRKKTGKSIQFKLLPEAKSILSYWS